MKKLILICAPICALSFVRQVNAQTLKASNKLGQGQVAIRRGWLDAIGADAPNYPANADGTQSAVAYPSSDTILGVSYHPSRADIGATLRSYRQFAWRDYANVKTYIKVVPIDYIHDIHAIAGVSGTSIPVQLAAMTNGKVNTAFSLPLGPFGSIPIASFAGKGVDANYDTRKTPIDNQSFVEPSPSQYPYRITVSGYASVDTDAGWASTATAQADLHQSTYGTNTANQFTAKQAYSYPNASR